MRWSRSFKEEPDVESSAPIIPSIDFRGDNNGSRWTTLIQLSGGKRFKFDAPKPLGLVQELTTYLVDEIGDERLGLDFNPGKKPVQDKLKAIARRGRQLYEALIEEERREEFLAVLGRATPLVPSAAPKRGLVVMYEHAFRIWWPFLYLDKVDENEPIDIGRFLGAKLLFVASEHADGFSDNDESGDEAAQNAVVREPPTVHHVWDNQLLVKSMPANDRWHHGIPTIKRKELVPPLANGASQYEAMKDRLAAFITREAVDTLQFDCHGHSHPAYQGLIDVGIRDDFLARNEDLTIFKFVGNPYLIAVLNVCLAGRGEVGGLRTSLAENMMANGVAALIAPMAKMPLKTLMATSRVLYTRLLSSETLLDAFEASQTLLLDEGNPIAHAFILHTKDLGFAKAYRFQNFGPESAVA